MISALTIDRRKVKGGWEIGAWCTKDGVKTHVAYHYTNQNVKQIGQKACDCTAILNFHEAYTRTALGDIKPVPDILLLFDLDR